MNNDTDIKKRIETYQKQEEVLQFEHFSNEDALDVGLLLVEYAKEKKYAVAIDITVNGYQMFKYGFAGASINNDKWIRRKINVVNSINKSSMLLGAMLESENLDMEKDYRLSNEDYAFHGGGFPIRIKGTGVIGTICVSGRPQQEDHQMIIDVLSKYLKKQV